MAITVLCLVWLSVFVAELNQAGRADLQDPRGPGSAIGAGTPLALVRNLAPAWAFVISGLIAWHRRPHNRIGPLMAAVGIGLLLWTLRGSTVPLVVSFGVWASASVGVSGFLLGLLVLAYPSGRIVGRLDRAWVALGACWLLIPQLALTLATPIGFLGCAECRPLIVLWYDEFVFMTLGNLSMLIFTALAFVLVILLARRWLIASRPARRVLAPVWLAGAVVPMVAVAVAMIYSTTDDLIGHSDLAVPSLGRFLRGHVPSTVIDFLPWAVQFSRLLVPLALLWGLLRTQLGQAAVSALAIDLARTQERAPLLHSLRRALGDHSLDLVLWSRPLGEYVTADGVTTDVAAVAAGRAVTRLNGDDGPLAALIHDPYLNEQHSLVDGVSAVARLALENERLHAEVKAQLEEVRASRERIVRAGDEERRRVERDIHDGAQQRLVSLSLALGMAHAKAERGSPDVVETLQAAEVELKHAIGELRELARGIHPAILTEAGLSAALESLADRSPVPVRVDATLDRRLPPLVEATAYYVAAEALTNIAKHAAATAASLSATEVDGWLHLTVADNGCGGADPTHGSGLRGLVDRVSAVGGRLSVENDGAAGTRVEAMIPCG